MSTHVLLACIWPSPLACKLVSSSNLSFGFYSTQNLRPEGGWVLNSSAWPWKTFVCWFCSTFAPLPWLNWTSPLWTHWCYTALLQVLPSSFHPLFCLGNLTCLSKSSLNVAGYTKPFGICSCQRDFSQNSCCTLFTLNFGHWADTEIHTETLISVGTKALLYTSSCLPMNETQHSLLYHGKFIVNIGCTDEYRMEIQLSDFCKTTQLVWWATLKENPYLWHLHSMLFQEAHCP